MADMKLKPWLKQPGELVDSKGVPIHPGDLLKSYHFTGARRKRYYLYHVAVYHVETDADGQEWGGMRMVPTCYLEPTKVGGGGECLLLPELAASCEVIHGHGPKPYLSFEDRPKVK